VRHLKATDRLRGHHPPPKTQLPSGAWGTSVSFGIIGEIRASNGEMTSQLQAGAQSFTVPFRADLGETESDITNDNPTALSTH
jgi:hypothetical protein